MPIQGEILLATAEDIAEGKPIRWDANFNPLGVAFDKTTGRLAVTSYSNPAILLGTLGKNKDGDLVWNATFFGGAKGKHHNRFFPAGVLHSRAQCVMFSRDGFWLSYNSGCEFFYFARDEEGAGWRLKDKTYLPDSLDNDNRMVHAAHLEGNDLWTIEADDPDHWFLRRLYMDNNMHIVDRGNFERAVAPFTYGIGMRSGDSRIWTITDHRCTGQPHGIYADEDLIIPGVTGSSITHIPDGSAIVADYSDLDEFDKPGALIFIPASMFN